MTSRLPACTSRRVLAALQRAGWTIHHTTGSHFHLRHPTEIERRVTIPMHGGDLKRGLLKGVLKQAGLTDEEFRNLL